VVTTSGAHKPPWLRDGETALLVAPEDPVALEDAIDRLLGDERLTAHVRAGASGLSFGWERIVEAVLASERVAAGAR
jgi:glycosyltransferase involved in cell wall biosynthesis